MALEATLTIFHQSPNLNKGLVIDKGFTATGCGQTWKPVAYWSLGGFFGLDFNSPKCAAGWTYTIDPAVTITNEAHDFIQGKLYGVTHATTLVTTDYGTIWGPPLLRQA